MKEIPTCIVCDKPMPDFKYEYCCNAFDCPCRGRPTNEPICSEECYMKLVEDD